MITNNETKTNATGAGATGTAGIPAGANITIPPHILNFCNRNYPPHLGSAYDAARAHLIAKRLIIEGFPPLPCDIVTFMATPAFAQLKKCPAPIQPSPKNENEKITPPTSTSATNVDPQPSTKINDPLQSAPDPLQTAPKPLLSTPKPQPSAPQPQQPTPKTPPSPTNNSTSQSAFSHIFAAHSTPSNLNFQLIADDYQDLLDKRSPLDRLTIEQQEALYQLLQSQSARDVAAWLAQEPPIGLGLKIHHTSVSAFQRRHAERKRILAQREKIQLAETIVNQAADKDDGYSNAAIRLLHGRVLKATADDDTNPDQLKTLVATLNALRKQTLAERKFAAS